MRIVIMLAALLATTPAAAIYQCKEANGRTSFQDTPCSGGGGKQLQVRPATGHAPASAPDDTAAGQGEQAKVDYSPAAQMRRMKHAAELSSIDREIADIEFNLEQDQLKMDAELDALRRKKSMANNNLAGATWEQSISTEMQAVAEKYRARLDMSRARISDLRRKRETLTQP